MSEVAALKLPRAVGALRKGIEDGVHYGAQLSVIYGDRRLDAAVGLAGKGTPMTPDHVLCWSSSVKPVMSMAVGRLHEQGRISLGDTVTKHVPAFGSQGKAAVTIAHCLTHTAGLWGAAPRGTSALAMSPEEVSTYICSQPLAKDWEPGVRCGYDTPAWFALASVVTAADTQGRAYERYAREEIFGPLGLDACSVGLPAERHEELRASGLLAPIYVAPRAGPRDFKPIPGEDDPTQVMFANPGGNGRGPARELASLYASLLPGAPGGRRVLAEAAVEELTRTAREGVVDELQGVDTAWSLGFALRSVLSGRHASPKAFGHGGSQSSWAFADPEHGLAVACLCNGKPGPELHYRRVGAVSTAIYEDLGLATEEGTARTFKLPAGLGTF